MNKEISKSPLKIKLNYQDMLFFVLLAATFYFTRNIICRIMMLVFFAYFIFLRIAERNTVIKCSFFLISYSVFVSYGAIMMFVGDVMDEGIVQTMVISLVLNLMMMYSIIIYVKRRSNVVSVIKTFECSIFVVAFIVVVMSLSTITAGRLGGGTEINANMLSMLCVYGLVLCLGMLKNHTVALPVFVFKILFYIPAILLTGSRKGLLMVVIATAVIMIVNERKKLMINTFKILLIVIVLYLIVTKITVFYNIIGHRVEDMLMLLFESQTEDNSLINRQRLIDIGMNYISQNKWFGYGLDCFKLVSGIFGTGDYGLYSHNNYIELLFGVGIIGLILYYIPMLWILIKLIKQSRRKPFAPYLLALFVSKLAVEYAYVAYYERIDAYIVAILVGIILYWDLEDKLISEKEKYHAVSKKTFEKSI